MTNEAVELARKLVPTAVELFGDCDVRLYGSYAKGCQRPDSDIDLAVIIREHADGETGQSFSRKCGKLFEAAFTLDDRFETVVRTLDDPSGFTRTVLETGIPLNP